MNVWDKLKRKADTYGQVYEAYKWKSAQKAKAKRARKAGRKKNQMQRIRFGKYKNHTIRWINEKDQPYLLWLLSQDWLKQNLRTAIISVISGEQKIIEMQRHTDAFIKETFTET